MTQDSAYTRAGVNIDAGNHAVTLMKESVRSTFTRAVLSDVGTFGGLFDAAAIKEMTAPVLVSSTDGVGTKTRVASKLNRWDGIGQDLVNHCINDILVQGARPLFFMDYIATSKVIPEQLAAIVAGMAEACRAAGCALLGGETAEMPGVYQDGEVDVAGTIVGVVERDSLITGSRIEVGDTLIGLPSNGLHTNGYSLARKVLANLDWTVLRDDLNAVSIGDALLLPHTSYLSHINTLLSSKIDIRGLAHITGGGITENLPRILPEGTAANLAIQWPIPPIFDLIRSTEQIPDDELFRVFNMGTGMIVVISRDQVGAAIAALPTARYIGDVTEGDRSVTIAMERP